MAVMSLFQKDVPLNKVGGNALREARMDLQMARNQSRQKMVDLETKKQGLFQKALAEKSKDLRRSYLSEISTIGFQSQLERRMLEGVEGQIRLVSVAEAVKEFQRRKVQSPLLEKLLKLNLTQLDGAMHDAVRQGFYGDEVASEIVRRWTTGFNLEGSEEIEQLEKDIEQAQALVEAGKDVKAVAQNLADQHSDRLGQHPVFA